jgi:feruloyl esterase
VKGIALPGARVTAAELVFAGKLDLPAVASAPDLRRRTEAMPGFCRVRAVITPTPQSQILVEIWLPSRHWNGRFLGTGNGGSGGSIAYSMGMIEGLKRGFAVANTDLGTGPSIEAAAARPERWVDYGSRATHEMTRVGKLVTQRFYRTAAVRSYFEGCSTGGQQALITAQRYPEDYDGILAGDPGNNRTHSVAYFLWNYAKLNEAPGSKLSPGQWSLVSRRILADCAGRDGGAPGDAFLTDPRRCAFDVASLPACAPSREAPVQECFAPPQLAALRALYAGPVNPRTGERIYPGLTLGSESQPLGPLQQGDPRMLARLYVLRWGLGAAPTTTFDFDRDIDRVDARLAAHLNANSSDLTDFARRGGKLLLYTGMADPGVPFADVINYYDRLLPLPGGSVSDFARLFLVPGMGHCSGGPGVTGFGQPSAAEVPDERSSDALMSLVAWSEGAAAPDYLRARDEPGGGRPGRERPICAYPAVPEYKRGDPAKFASFACIAHATGSNQPVAPRYVN